MTVSCSFKTVYRRCALISGRGAGNVWLGGHGRRRARSIECQKRAFQGIRGDGNSRGFNNLLI